MRKNLPKDVTNAKLKRGELAAKSCNDITVCKWKDKRDVLRDQMVSYYSCLKDTQMAQKLALHIFEVYLQNAHRLLRLKDRASKIRLLKFREDFVKYLMGLNCGPQLCEAPGPQIPPVQPEQDQADPSPLLPGPSVPPASPAVHKVVYH
ncbi:hypothetical protein EVAR_39166_1 [Eumeta japonica]|uniref:PiggyBac transposable element-derived protein 4 n=1 Tax=Eumeta variegata TaxID=151549 RepID=A0A4C1S9P9_EUMVA|nr:hypothetical protein EVAR_39166_1 [Eumeta japonica]